MKIKAVILDFGGTLSEGDLEWDPYHEAIQGVLTREGYPVEMGDLKKAIRGALQDLAKVRNRGRERTFEEVYSDVLGSLGVPPDVKLLDEIHEAFRTHYKTEYLHCAEAVLREISSKYKVALLSNTMSDHPRVLLERSGYDRYFTYIICSRDVGVRKPNPEIFKMVLDKLKVGPDEAVHVGDRVDADMYGARDSGITGVWIKTPDQLPWSGHVINSICELPRLLQKMET